MTKVLGEIFAIQNVFEFDEYGKGLYRSKHHSLRMGSGIFSHRRPEKVFYIVFEKLEEVESIACTIRGRPWSAALHAMEVSVLDIVGIWEYSKHIYMLRKHPC